MPSSLVWAVDVSGRVYTLSTVGQQWELCKDRHLEFKRVAAAKQCCWGIACDQQVYVYVHSSDVPIRYQEEAFENQRWNPVDGFSDRLLPSDRWQWSDITGLKHQPLNSFHLPSEHWDWESDWYVDENIGGEPTEKGGWTYAMDFPATYTKDKKWNSCVRRRRWIRYRRYRSRDVWAKISSFEDKKYPDPINDITVGGWEITDEPVGYLSVWAVTLLGKIFYREDVSHHNPEGASWTQVDSPGEVIQISCGPFDLLWAVLWEGQTVVREGISRDNPKGTSWKIVEAPSSNTAVVHVSVGVNVVWAVTRDKKVWFRRGVSSHNPAGSGWIGMVGEMLLVSVGLNDQVWGISCDDRTVYYRQGITVSELSGKNWKAVVAGREDDRSQTGSASSLFSAGCFFGEEVQVPTHNNSEFSEPDRLSGNSADADSAAESSQLGAHCQITEASNSSVLQEMEEQSTSGFNRDVKDSEQMLTEQRQPSSQQEPQVVMHKWSNVNLADFQPHTETYAKDPLETSSLSSIAVYPVGTEDRYVEEHSYWAWLSCSGCEIDCHTPLKWFTAQQGLASSVAAMSLFATPAETETWKKQIFEQLNERTKREQNNFQHYEQAIEQHVWVKKGSMQWWKDWKPHKWMDVQVMLEQFKGYDGKQDSILFVYYMHYGEKKYIHVFLNEVTVLVPVLSDTRHSFAVYTPERTKQRWPIRLAAATEQEMHDWLAVLNLACCECRGSQGPPSHQAVWSVTCNGDIFFSEPYQCLEAVPYPVPCDQMVWRQIGGHLRQIECNSLGIVWGIGYDNNPWVYTGGYGGGFFQGLASSTNNIYAQTDVKCVYIYENQRWNPVTGYSSRGLPTDRYMWSDASGLQEQTKTNTKPLSPQWTWTSDWYIDFKTPGGTDREGWQYAADFPASYSGYKTMKDFVRRRRWARKCKLTTTGPWLEVPPILLWDISLIPSISAPQDGHVAVWGISNKGDVLCRIGVTKQNPSGTSWLHVGTDQPFVSVSIGVFYQVWAIARDGSAFYRGSVTSENPAGDCWYHILSPLKQKLKQLSVGRTTVCAVDESCNLWFRQGITPSYPQGSSWEHISTNVRKVSVGPLDQIWIIADKVQGSHSLSCGTVCHRTGVNPLEPKGHSWDYGIGGGWDHVTVRGNSLEPPRNSLDESGNRSEKLYRQESGRDERKNSNEE
ncbi:tectonin beta-propeller repeat-containing protein 1 [Protopterus annectens]|uniref:tectonin beta-propeller repeat-containing protein 1 n=1 Tax=Protopterus annectens TaxID=7888 RepID=UPI001CF98DA6|nr:tectonin beta-propeller repeat-containing protein 1 [Protopterus annectens]